MTTEEELKLLNLPINAKLNRELDQEAMEQKSQDQEGIQEEPKILEEIDIKDIKDSEEFLNQLSENQKVAKTKRDVQEIQNTISSIAEHKSDLFSFDELAEVLAPLKSYDVQKNESNTLPTNKTVDSNWVELTDADYFQLYESLDKLKSKLVNGTNPNLEPTAQEKAAMRKYNKNIKAKKKGEPENPITKEEKQLIKSNNRKAAEQSNKRTKLKRA